MNQKNLLSTAVSSTLVIGALLLAGCAAAPAGSSDTVSTSSPDLNGNPIDPGSLVGGDNGFQGCSTDADCPGSCAGEDILCCPVCSVDRVCAVTCGAPSHTPSSTQRVPRTHPR
jgi:hypothetical protein